jgi:DNA-binding NtrC family response regulator
MKDIYNVLIVDADEEKLSILERFLKQESYEVEVTQSAKDAFEKVKNKKYHIVITNITMPNMDGIELLKEIKKYDPMTQIIMMAEHSTMDKILNALEYGANDYIELPFKSEEFVKEVIDYSVQKLERWRDVILQLVK